MQQASTEGVVVPSEPEKTCLRCKSQPSTAHFRDAHYCQPCALAVIDVKTKTGLELARGAGLAKYVESVSSASDTPPNDASKSIAANIGVAFSGGVNSRVLLRMVRSYFRPQASDSSSSHRFLSQKQPKTGTSSQNTTGRFTEVATIFVFYVDSSSLFPPGSEGSVDRTKEIEDIIAQEKCPDMKLVPLKIEDIYASPSSTDSFSGLPWTWAEAQDQSMAQSSQPVTNAKKAVRDLMQSICPTDVPRTAASSARTRLEDLHRTLLHFLLRRAAQQYDCSALLYGETGTRMSIRLIESLAKGAGHKLPIEISDACWIDSTLAIRPLKAHLAHEIQYFAKEKCLNYLEGETVLVPATVVPGQMVGGTPVMDKTSISRLTETFILNLEKGVPSTVSTIGRTGSKMVLNSIKDDAHGAGFDVVGPSVPLPSRGVAPLSDSVSSISLDPPSTPATKEPRIGTRAIRLAQTSSSCPRWNTSRGCVLCRMPYSKDARFWKRNITISSLTHVEPHHDALPPSNTLESVDAANTLPPSWINLADHLCYACLLVLLPSPTAPTPSLLPPFILHNLKNKLDSPLTDNSCTSPVLQQSEQRSENPQRAQQFVQHKLDSSQIKAQINEFLI